MPPRTAVQLGNNVTIGDNAVVFRSVVGDGSTIGAKAYVDKSQLAPNSVVPDGQILIGNVVQGTVEW